MIHILRKEITTNEAENVPMTVEKKHYLFRSSGSHASRTPNEERVVLVLFEKLSLCERLSIVASMEEFKRLVWKEEEVGHAEKLLIK